MRSDAPRHETVFQHAREHSAPLARFANIAALLLVLPFAHDVPDDEQAAVVTAVIAQCHGAAAAFWQGVLVIAFEPMLRAMADAWPKLPRDERESIVLLAFFEAIKSARDSQVADGILRYLRRATAGGAARLALRELTEGGHLGEDADARDSAYAPDERDTRDGVAALARELAADEVDDAELIPMLVATVQGESLADYVARSYPDADARQRSYVYQRLLRKRARALGRKRATHNSVQ